MLRIVTAVNTRNDLDFGGSPGALMKRLNRVGMESKGMNLRPPVLYSLARYIWVLSRVLRLRIPHGFQFSRSSETLRKFIIERSTEENDIIGSLFQISTQRKRKKFFVLDCTLKYLFANYSEVSQVPEDIRANAIEMELRSYEQAQHIFCKSQECMNEIVRDYGIPSGKVTLLPWGPNFEMELNSQVLHGRLDDLRESVNLLFLGKDAFRKGFDKVLHFKNFLESQNIKVRLRVIGLDYSELFPHDLDGSVEYFGFIPPSSDQFARIFEGSHIGFLVSRSEALGIAALEFQAAGLPVILSGVDGMMSSVKTSTYIVDNSSTLEKSAMEVIERVQEGRFQDWLLQAWDEAPKARVWDTTVKLVVDSLAN
jgi:glycosyltransferase involved in cell wall biosynthesis